MKNAEITDDWVNRSDNATVTKLTNSILVIISWEKKLRETTFSFIKTTFRVTHMINYNAFTVLNFWCLKIKLKN